MRERVFPLAVLIASATYLLLALPLPRGHAARPGAGFFPLGVGLFLCLAAAACLVAPPRPRAAVAAAPVTEAPPGWRARVRATAGALVGFCVLLPVAGYALVAFAFVAVVLRELGAGWKVALGTAVGSAIASYYLFAVALGVPLPGGVLFR